MDFANLTQSIKIKYTKTTSILLDDLAGHASSPLAKSTLYTTKMDRALFIFFSTIGLKEFSLEKVNKVSRRVFQVVEKKAGEIPISAAKIGQGKIPEVLIAVYLAHNKKIDLIKSIDNEDESSDEYGKEFKKGMTNFIENTIEFGSPIIRKQLINDNDTSPMLSLTSFARRVKRQNIIKFSE